MELTLTSKEQDIIQHRLEVVDCILECLTGEGSDLGLSLAEVEEAIERVGLDVSNGILRTPKNKAEWEVIYDALDGATYFGSAVDAVDCKQISKSTLQRRFQAADSLEAKARQLLGVQIAIPRR